MRSALLKDLCDFRHGGTPSKAVPAYWSGDIPWVSPKDMKAAMVCDASDRISEAAVANSATSIAPIGSTLLVVRSGILAHTLPVALVTAPVAFNQDIKAVVPRSPDASAAYIYWFLRSRASEVIARGVKKGATVHSVQSGFVEGLQVPVPGSDEQQRIVDLLSRAEGIVRLRRQAQQKAASLIPAIFVDMFGDPVTNPKGWARSRLGDLSAVQGGLQVTRARESLPLDLPYLRVANVYRARLELGEVKNIRLTEAEFERTRLVSGDLLFVEGHGNPQEVGRVAIWDDSIPNCTHQNHLIRARLNFERLLPEYACWLLNSAGGRQSLLRAGKTTSGLSTISVQNVKDAEVLLPPLEIQSSFKRQVEAVEAISALLEAAVTKAEATFNALLARAFSAAGQPVQPQAERALA